MFSSVLSINDQAPQSPLKTVYEETEANQDQAVPDLSNAGITMNGLSPASSRSVSTRVDIRDIGDHEKELEIPDSDNKVIPSVTDAKGTADQIEKEPSMKFKKWFRPFFNFFQKYYLSLIERETAWDEWVKTQQLDRPDVPEYVLIHEAMDWPKDKKPLPPLGLTSTEKADLSKLKQKLRDLETAPDSEILVAAITTTKGYKKFEKQLTDEVIKASFEALGTLLGLCPLIPKQVSEFVGTIGIKINDYKDKESKAKELFEPLIEEGQTFMDLLLNTKKTLTDLSHETNVAKDKINLVTETETFQAIIETKSAKYGKVFGDCHIELRRLMESNNATMWDTVSGYLMRKKANPEELYEKLNMVRNGIRDEILVYIGVTTGKTLDAVRDGFRILEELQAKNVQVQTELDLKSSHLKEAEEKIEKLEEILTSEKLKFFKTMLEKYVLIKQKNKITADRDSLQTERETLEMEKEKLQLILKEKKKEEEELKIKYEKLDQRFIVGELNIKIFQELFFKRTEIHKILGDKYEVLKSHLIHAALVFNLIKAENHEQINAKVKVAVALIKSLDMREAASLYFPDFDGLTDFVVKVAVRGEKWALDGKMLYRYSFSEQGILNVRTVKPSDMLKMPHYEIIDEPIKDFRDFLLQ
ncbi:hypothetical protein BCR33DRAFT_792124 [Rhizoclosmatium globosum]|uniref:Uncharacterized protein n=1 Tax=Rhizoclosmatium globosum TaxID=329046 RepID=A0A1Y2BBQ1_9FUNG|nr:hypothetical protein BCR33DRAFT_792124 [Rhizoclosmatium globosum]|eukprot:ORY31515.1 hypothetical protein BCR33DRAFT_792124 [Rhizoclosmatium globosum]